VRLSLRLQEFALDVAYIDGQLQLRVSPKYQENVGVDHCGVGELCQALTQRRIPALSPRVEKMKQNKRHRVEASAPSFESSPDTFVVTHNSICKSERPQKSP